MERRYSSGIFRSLSRQHPRICSWVWGFMRVVIHLSLAFLRVLFLSDHPLSVFLLGNSQEEIWAARRGVSKGL